MVFANPNYLYLLLLLLPMIGWYIYKLSKSQASLRVSSSEAFDASGATSWIVYLRHVPFLLRMLAIALLIVVLARPQSTNSWSNSSTEGIDIMLAMDISGSMLAQDLKPNRLEAAKDVDAFLRRLAKVFPGIPVELEDERFTSVLAHRAMIDGGMKKKDRMDKSSVDRISAAIILQSYLDRRNLTKENEQEEPDERK